VATPHFSVIIPTFERAASLRNCLAGVTRLDFPAADFEVIVVDDGGRIELEPVLAGFQSAMCLRLVRQERGGPGAARNAGAAVARGRFLAFIDDDCVPTPGWLGTLARALARHPDDLVGGLVANALPANPYADASDRISRFVYDYYRRDDARERFFTTNNIALSSDLFRSLGGFTTVIPSRTAEDKEFCDRWHDRGLALLHVPEAVVHHAHDLTFLRFLRQHYHYGRGIFAFRQLRRARTHGPLVPEGWGFYVGLVTSPLRSSAHGRSLRAALLIAFAQLATLAGALQQAATGTVRPR